MNRQSTETSVEGDSNLLAIDAAESQKTASGGEVELAKYIPHFGRMSEQLRQTSAQIEDAVVTVCGSFLRIAQRARETVDRASGLLTHEEADSDGSPSFEGLIENCSGTLVKVLSTTEEVNEISKRAIERIQQIDKVSQEINAALLKLEQIAKGNRMLAMNARIEAAHAGDLGTGFAVVAKEVVSQTDRSQKVTSQVGDLISNLRDLAGSTLSDLQKMNDQDYKRVAECRQEVDESLQGLRSTHAKMAETLTVMTREGEMLADDIGTAVRGLQFQDRTNQRIGHVIEDLDTLRAILVSRFGSDMAEETASDAGFSSYTMHEEREVAGIDGEETGQGEIELF